MDAEVLCLACAPIDKLKTERAWRAGVDELAKPSGTIERIVYTSWRLLWQCTTWR